MGNNDYVLGFVMAGGRGSRFGILTRDRCKPAVNILGHYRIGLRPYREVGDGMVEGDFCIDPGTEIMIIGRQDDADPKKPILPDGLKC